MQTSVIISPYHFLWSTDPLFPRTFITINIYEIQKSNFLVPTMGATRDTCHPPILLSTFVHYMIDRVCVTLLSSSSQSTGICMRQLIWLLTVKYIHFSPFDAKTLIQYWHIRQYAMNSVEILRQNQKQDITVSSIDARLTKREIRKRSNLMGCMAYFGIYPFSS